MGDSVAVHVAPGVNPLIVVTNGVLSDAEPEDGDGEPLVQVTLTETDAPLFGTKSLLTVRVAVFRVLVIVQLTLLPFTSVLFRQSAWFAV